MLQDNPGNSGQDDLYRARLESIIDLRHELAKLARLVDWDGLQQDLSQFYCADRGRPGGSVRLMAGNNDCLRIKNPADRQARVTVGQ